MSQASPDDVALAVQFYQRGHYAAAAQHCLAVLAREPESVGALQLLSFVRFAEGQAAEAIAVGRRAIAAVPDHPSNQHNLGLMPAGLGRPDEALESYDRPLALKPDFIDV